MTVPAPCWLMMSRTKLAMLFLVVIPLVMCAGAVAVGGVFASDNAAPRPCRPPADEPARIAAYLADPVLTFGQPTAPSGQPSVVHACDGFFGDNSRWHGYTAVSYTYPVGLWLTNELRDRYGPVAVAEGWVEAGNHDRAAVFFCRTVDGVAATLIIAIADIGGSPVELREIVSVPPHVACPFDGDVWGVTYYVQ